MLKTISNYKIKVVRDLYAYKIKIEPESNKIDPIF